MSVVSTFVSVTPLDRDNFQLLDGFDKKLGCLQLFLWEKNQTKKQVYLKRSLKNIQPCLWR